MAKFAYKFKKLLTNYIGFKIIPVIVLFFLCTHYLLGQTYETRSFGQVSSGSTIALTKPAGTVGGELLLVVISLDYTTTSSFFNQSGWLLLDQGIAVVDGGKSAVYYKITGNNEPASYNIGFPGSGKAFAQMVRYSGVDALQIGSHAHNSPTSAPYNIAPATSISYTPTKIIRILRGNGAGTLEYPNFPTGYSIVGEYNAHGKSITIIDAPVTVVGNQDTLTVPHTITNTPYRNSSIIIRGMAVNMNAPTQGNEYISTNEDTSIGVNILLNNTDSDGDIVSLNSLTSVTSQGGTIGYTMVDSVMTYLPPANFNGIDTAFYVVQDDGNPVNYTNDSIFITVNPIPDPPSQGNESISLAIGTSTTVNLLANNIDPDGDLVWLSGALVRRPSNNGFVYSASDSTLTYTASSSFSGVDSVFYSVRNGLGETVLDTVLVYICGSSTDCDGDGVSDTQEVSDGTDPNDPCDYDGIVLTSTSGLTVCEGASIFFNNQSLTASGTYKDTLSSVSGCDSIVTLNLTVLPKVTTTLTESICDDMGYFFNFNSYFTTGTYTANHLSSTGCDSIVTLNLTVHPTGSTTLNEEICTSSSYVFNGTSYNAAGTYTANLLTSEGCDSTVTLNLTVHPTVSTTLNEEICANSGYTFNGTNYNTAGTHTANLLTSEGCDSTVTLNLTVNPTGSTTLNEEICTSSSYVFNGTSYNAAGTYTANLLTSEGCDSTVTLNLTVHPTVSTILTEEICTNSSYVFNGTSYNTSGTYTANLLTSEGCDSTVTLNLIVHPTVSTTLTEEICTNSSYAFNGTSYNTTGMYTANLLTSEGCDSIVTLNLTVSPTVSTTLTEEICTNSSYAFNGTNYNTTGTYTANLMTSEGCDSTVTLNLTVNPTVSTTLTEEICTNGSYAFNGMSYNTSGTYTANLLTSEGCDSTVTLNLTVNPTVSTTLTEEICTNGSYAFNGTSYNTSGTYTANLLTSESCDSTVTLNLIVHPITSTTLTEEICTNGSYAFNGTSYNTSGTYTANLLTSEDCDSTVTLNLTVNPTVSTTLNEEICTNSSYAFNGTSYNTAGTYTANLLTSEGCDSIVTLNLTVNPIVSTTLTEEICTNSSYAFNGTSYNTAGIYTANLLTSEGCDSTVTLNLTVNPTVSTTLNEEICNNSSYIFNGVSYNSTGTYIANLLTTNGCDSFIVLNLVVHPVESTILNETICQGGEYILNGIAYSSAGIYTDRILSSKGCDSLITLNLMVGENYTTVINQEICEGSAYTFNNKVYSSTGIYQDTLISLAECDSIFTLNITSLPILYTTILDTICQGSIYSFNGADYVTDGIYTFNLLSSLGCDSIVTLDLTTQPCVDLALQKDLAPEQSDTVRLGDKISYEICIINEGISDAYNILITDHLPQGMFLDPDNVGWTFNNNGDAVYTIPGPLSGGQQQCIPIYLNLLDPSTETINNYAEISGVTDERGIFIADFDSSPSDENTDEFEDDIDFVPIIFNPCPSVIVGSFDINICKGDTIQLEGFGGSANATYQWGGGGDLSCINCPKPFVSPDTTSTYILTIKEITGCEASNFSRIIVHAPTLDLGADKNICSGTTINLDANTTAVSYEWTASDNSVIDSIASPFIAPSNTTNYCLTVTDEFGCTATDCITVYVKETLTTTLVEQICDGSFYLFDGQELTTSGTYTDILQSSTGCDSIVTLQLSKVPCVDLSLKKDLSINQSDTVRIGETIHYEICIENEGISPAYNIEITDHIPAGLNLSANNTGWTLLANDDAIYTIDGPLKTGDIICVPIYLDLRDPTEGFIKNYAEISGVTDERGVFIADFDSSPNSDSEEEEEFEDDIDFETIYFDPCPFVSVAGQRFTICEGDSIELQAIGGSDLAAYQWGTQANLSCYDCKNPIASPKDTTVYVLTINEVTGCSASTTVTVNVQKNSPIDIGGDQFICLGTTITVSTDPVGNIEWTLSDGTFLSNEPSLPVTPGETTTYCVNTIGEDGCTNSDCATIFVRQTITTNINKQICEGTTFNFNGQILNESGQYSTNLIGEMGCDSVVNLNLLVYPVIRTNIIDTICIGTTYNFDNQLLTEAGTYTNIYATSDGCDSITVLTLVTENCADLSLRTQLTTGQNATFAIGDTVDYEIVVLNEGAVPMHTIQIVSRLPQGISPLRDGNTGWTLNSSASFLISDPLQPGTSNIIKLRLRIEPTIQGFSTTDILTEITAMYYADGTLAQDIDSDTSPTDEPNRPLEDDESLLTLNILSCNDFVVSAGAYQRVCQGETVLLEATGGFTYQWSPSVSLNQATVFNPLATPLATTTYTVTATDENGCTAMDQVQVVVESCDTPSACTAIAFACPDKTICKGRSAQLVVSGGVKWEWSPKENLSNFNSDIPVASPTVTTNYTVTVTDQNGCTVEEFVTVFVNDCRKNITDTDTEEQILLSPKVFLQGAILPNEPLMQDQLRVKKLIPLEEPYSKLSIYGDSELIFETKGSGGETMAATVLEKTGSDAIVDWVFLELRWEYDPSKVIRTRSALIQRDGDIVDIDGYSPVRFNIPADNYYLAVRHRNHLGVMTQEAISLKRNSLHTIDFTKTDESCYILKDTPKSSQYPMIQIGNTSCLWGGNSNGDNKLIFQGPGLDQEKLFFDIALHPDNVSEDGFPNYNFIIRGYLQGDNNMDGELRYQGPNNDIDALQFFNILQHKENERFLTNKIIYEQLPRK